MRTRTVGAFPAVVVAVAVVLGVVAGERPAAAQGTPFVPYFGKNLVHYGNFDWHSYTTDHFIIYYYPEIEHHLERVAGYAESAYQQVSADLKHDLAFKVPLVFFKTHVEFEQENVIPGAAQEGVAAFAEPTRNRMLLPLDEPPDLLYRTITHELTHIFEFDIIPQSLIRREEPLWINEGLSDYEAGYWAPLDLATVRDAAVADIVPKMSNLEGYGNFNNPRLIYNLGHAVFEFIESRWGKEGIRQFLFSLRKSVIGGGDSAYDEAFKMKADEFDQAFEKYLKDRFKPFRDKERPADYGRDLAPNPEKSSFISALTAEPSPSGDLFAIVSGNRKDREYDIILVSAKDGQVVRNLTPGFDKDMGFDNLSIPGTRWNTVPWLAWSPGGDRIAYVVRMGKGKGIILEDIVTRQIVDRIKLDLDEPESPSIAPNGRVIVFSALRNAKSDIWAYNLDTRQVTNVTNDAFYNYAPTFSPDGKFIVYLARVSGNEKLFRYDLDTKKSTQLTFGTHDDGAAKFLDAETIVFPSTAVDPTQPIDPEVAKNGNIYNVWTLNLKNGELKQYTDSLGGNVCPVPLKDTKTTRVAFITYYKGDYGLHAIDLNKPLKVAATSDFGAPGPIIDFQAPLSHTLVAQNKKKKGRFEKLFLDGRPPVNVGVTNNGDIFGGTDISFSDVLGDHRFTFTAASIAQYRTFAGSYMNLSKRFQYAVQGFSQKEFYYGASNAGYFYDPAYSPYISRDLATATRSMWGGSVFGIYPLDMYRRVEMSGGYMHLNESYNDPNVAAVAGSYQDALYGRTLFNNGSLIPLSVSFIQETTVFREFGPLAGNTFRVSYEYAPKVGNSLERRTMDGDFRYYQRLGGTGLLAMRFMGFRSAGTSPGYTYFGGNSEMRGYDYLEFIGQKAAFANAELRFPLIEAMLTPIGVMGGIRGVFFANIGGGWFDNSGYVFWTNKSEQYAPFLGVQTDPISGNPILDENGNPIAVYAPARTVSGFRLRDARASYGIGLETFALGFPIHFDWAWRTLFNKNWENALFATQGDLINGTTFGAEAWRKARFSVWIGYDF